MAKKCSRLQGSNNNPCSGEIGRPNRPGAGGWSSRYAPLPTTEQPEKPPQGIALFIQIGVAVVIARLDTAETVALQVGTDFWPDFHRGQAGFGYAAQVRRTESGRDGALIEQFLGHRIRVTPDGGWPARVKELHHSPGICQALA